MCLLSIWGQYLCIKCQEWQRRSQGAAFSAVDAETYEFLLSRIPLEDSKFSKQGTFIPLRSTFALFNNKHLFSVLQADVPTTANLSRRTMWYNNTAIFNIRLKNVLFIKEKDHKRHIKAIRLRLNNLELCGADQSSKSKEKKVNIINRHRDWNLQCLNCGLPSPHGTLCICTWVWACPASSMF